MNFLTESFDDKFAFKRLLANDWIQFNGDVPDLLLLLVLPESSDFEKTVDVRMEDDWDVSMNPGLWVVSHQRNRYGRHIKVAKQNNFWLELSFDEEDPVVI